MILTLIGLYLVALLALGLASQRLSRGTGEDFFLASRGLGPFVLLMSLVGTHMTAFSILGASGESYQRGVGVFALMASSSALVIPLIFLFIGVPLWRLGKQHGYLTQVQFFRERYASPALGLLLFALLVLLLVPYLLIGVKSAGLTLAQASGGQLPSWVGSGLMCAVVLGYVLTGGMRGTAWVNVFQTVIFLFLGAATFWVISNAGAGFTARMTELSLARPDLLTWGGKIPLPEMMSYALIPLSAAMFPHLFTHWLTARSASTFRGSVVLYPLCVAVVWLPSVLLGVLGRLDFPSLAPAEASSVLVRLIGLHAGPTLAAMLTAGVFVAVMASTDSQVLALGNMFTQDLVRHYRGQRWFNGASRRRVAAPQALTERAEQGPAEPHDRMSEAAQLRAGRLFITLVMLVAWGLSEWVDRSIFKMGVWCFTGFAGLFPLVVAALYWRRSTQAGAIASVITAAVSWLGFNWLGWGISNYTVGGSGLMPVAVVVAASAVVLVAVSLATRPPEDAHLARFFTPVGGPR